MFRTTTEITRAKRPTELKDEQLDKVQGGSSTLGAKATRNPEPRRARGTDCIVTDDGEWICVESD